MFTGIIESIGRVDAIMGDGENLLLTVSSSISSSLTIDQSVAHNGVCLTVVHIDGGTHQVVAIGETLLKTTLGSLAPGDLVNLERAMMMNTRLDGHIVQGHVDGIAKCQAIEEQEGSWQYLFEYDKAFQHLIVEKGSICLNGISLTVFDLDDNKFKVAIIPYTYAHTNIHLLQVGTYVNLEFDIIGKYVARIHTVTSSFSAQSK